MTENKPPTKEEFAAFERVRRSGVTNMFYVKNVCRISGVARETVLDIMEKYSELCEIYPDVRKI